MFCIVITRLEGTTPVLCHSAARLSVIDVIRCFVLSLSGAAGLSAAGTAGVASVGGAVGGLFGGAVGLLKRMRK